MFNLEIRKTTQQQQPRKNKYININIGNSLKNQVIIAVVNTI